MPFWKRTPKDDPQHYLLRRCREMLITLFGENDCYVMQDDELHLPDDVEPGETYEIIYVGEIRELIRLIDKELKS